MILFILSLVRDLVYFCAFFGFHAVGSYKYVSFTCKQYYFALSLGPIHLLSSAGHPRRRGPLVRGVKAQCLYCFFVALYAALLSLQLNFQFESFFLILVDFEYFCPTRLLTSFWLCNLKKPLLAQFLPQTDGGLMVRIVG